MNGAELGQIMGESYINGIISGIIQFAPFLIALAVLAIAGKLIESAITRAIDEKRRNRKNAKNEKAKRK